MSQKTDCEHEWVYDTCVMLSYPQQENRICRKCLKTETIIGSFLEDTSEEYEDLLRKAKEINDKAAGGERQR